MNKIKNFLKSHKLFITVLTFFVLILVLFGNYHVDVNPNIDIQLCHEKALGLLLETFTEEDAKNNSMLLPLNSETGTEELQRYKLQYDIAFDFCLNSRGFNS
jgi:hypothetical protein